MNKEMNEEIKMKLEEIKKKINAVTQRGIMYECKGVWFCCHEASLSRQLAKDTMPVML